MKIEMWPVDKPKPCPTNPRIIPPEAIEAVGKSLKAYGFRQPIVVDKDGVVVVGHGRLMGARHIGLTEVPVHVASDLSPKEIQAYRIADNRTNEESGWDQEMLNIDLKELDDFFTGFTVGELPRPMRGEGGMGSDAEGYDAEGNPLAENYSRKIEPPVYTPSGEKPTESELYDRAKTQILSQEIDHAERAGKVPADVARFLRFAAERHTVFRFDRIAEYYAHAPADVQTLFENSALVIIDFNKAIELGYVRLTEKMLEQAGISKAAGAEATEAEIAEAAQ